MARAPPPSHLERLNIVQGHGIDAIVLHAATEGTGGMASDQIATG